VLAFWLVILISRVKISLEGFDSCSDIEYRGIGIAGENSILLAFLSAMALMLLLCVVCGLGLYTKLLADKLPDRLRLSLTQ
jgi:hypothetical protein